MDGIAQTRVPAHQEMEHARSTQRNHVSRETGSRPYPLANSACLSQVHGAHTLLPFTMSLCAAKRHAETCPVYPALRRGGPHGCYE